MSFKSGREKTGGNKKGGLHSPQRFARNIVETALKCSIPEKLLQLASEMDINGQADIYKALMPYCYAKLQAVEHSGEIANTGDKEELEKLKAKYRELTSP